ncbi:hypothetical protein DFH08DRAFT_1088518 [Mycena albidolilacea]|uniref:Uncharacterized protein n=1 Tax=Mycena albidolilacea TaxID=1033008 RepID=A0AAD6Z5E3_9AGAR|nr:hypothetical protein DFH08DRAFT_1088518 [Mycena albidolilacea]
MCAISSRAQAASIKMFESQDMEMTDAASLFDSDQESFELDKVPVHLKGKHRKVQSDSGHENQWSSVFTQQLYARINRPGQTRDAYVSQFAGQNTIEMLLVMIALRKASTTTDYLALERREALFKALVSANMEEDGADSQAFLELEAEGTAKKRKCASEVDNPRKRSVKAPKSARTVEKPKAGAQKGKKRKADHDADAQEPPIKRTSVASKKTLKGQMGEAFFKMHRGFLSKYREKCHNALSQFNEDGFSSTDEELQVPSSQIVPFDEGTQAQGGKANAAPMLQ